LIAINDALLLENSVYKILKRYIGNESIYLQVLDLFIEASRRTSLGQYLDLTSSIVIDTIGTTNKSLNVNRYMSIIKNKISYYSYYLPIAVAMILSGITDSKVFIFIEKILLDMGEFYQIENDFLDYYSENPTTIGKNTWLLASALERVASNDRQLLIENYRNNDIKSIEIVKQVYNTVEIPKLYYSEKKIFYDKIHNLLTSKEDEIVNYCLPIINFMCMKLFKTTSFDFNMVFIYLFIFNLFDLYLMYRKNIMNVTVKKKKKAKLLKN
jgi:farnesyl diphosphate synthase